MSEIVHSERLAILDAGAQYGKVIDRRVRELNVESVLLPLNTSAEDLNHFRALIVSGGPESVYADNAPKYDPRLLALGKPVLGICYGMQLINYFRGGMVNKTRRREDGPCNITVDTSSLLFRGLNPNQEVLMSHGDSVTEVPEGFKVSARSNGLIAGIENPKDKLYGVQFHPEVDLTVNGRTILRNFLYEIACFTGSYTIEDRRRRAIDYIKEGVKDRDVLVLVSGGVDSTVCAALLAEAITPKRIHAIHIDNGFMRLGESDKVKAALGEIGINLKVVNAAEDFYHGITTTRGDQTKPLRETVNPEEKRLIIGDQFMKVSQRAIEDLGLNPEEVVLAQGTLRPDLIESASQMASGNAATIKTHHNDTPLVRELRSKGMVIEPLKDYHKDEVRTLGLELGLPEEIVWRQPFPGPGLAVRIICGKTPYVTDDFEQINELLTKYTSSDISTTLLPIQTVGIQGDGRTYSYLAGLSGKDNWDELFRVAREIPKEIHQVNRIAYIFGERISGPVTETTPTFLTPEVIKQLQMADDIVNRTLFRHGLLRGLSQVPVVSFPVNFGIPGNRSIAIRTFITNDFMTGVPARPGQDISKEALNEMVIGILSGVNNISRIAYDLTSKPPGTTEWE
ncbi:glutamine-hydrolyzing GMP synthase [Candidatus Daviesbacteria bacterium]|nr:glutamine-hydrolyzing GMP synthase [Candidatus Daviesbacteria bacterium]